MIKILQSLLLVLPLSLSSPLLAQDAGSDPGLKYYDVEIIVFRNDNVPRAHELNLPTPSASEVKDAFDLADPASIASARSRGFTPLAPEQLKLLDKVDGIIKSSRYSLLLHTGWRQPGIDEKDAIPVWIRGGKIYSNSYSSIDQFKDVNAVSDVISTNTRQTPSAEKIRPKGLYELEGKITVSLSRYLHTNAELVLRKPATPTEILQQSTNPGQPEDVPEEMIGGQLLLNYGLNEKRRMRSKKLHYLDSPQFGMLVLITPYEAPEPTGEAPPQDVAPADATSPQQPPVNKS